MVKEILLTQDEAKPLKILGFPLKRNFVLRTGHPKKREVYVMTKKSVCQWRGWGEGHRNEFWFANSVEGGQCEGLITLQPSYPDP